MPLRKYILSISFREPDFRRGMLTDPAGLSTHDVDVRSPYLARKVGYEAFYLGWRQVYFVRVLRILCFGIRHGSSGAAALHFQLFVSHLCGSGAVFRLFGWA